MSNEDLTSSLMPDERRVARQSAKLTATWEGPSFGPERANICDVNALGCCVEASHAVIVGTYVKLSVAGSTTAGWVVWRNGLKHGIDFSDPLVPAPVAGLLKRPGS
ncbi:hypothetical protein NOVOSPHI9U_210006 [Novosphingobium sp. 9U]|nr:hypothetical protein NOVOSPHI9U_210006 [Novosphingobium sp. 9U]